MPNCNKYFKNRLPSLAERGILLALSLWFLYKICGDFRGLSMVDDNVNQWLPVMNAAFEELFSTGHLPGYSFFLFGGLRIFDVGYYGLYNPLAFCSFLLGKLFSLDTIPVYIILCFLLGNLLVYQIARKSVSLPWFPSVLVVLAYATSGVFYYMSYWYYIWNNYWIVPCLVLAFLRWHSGKYYAAGFVLFLSLLSGNIQYTVFHYMIFGIISLCFILQNRQHLKHVLVNFSYALVLSAPFLVGLMRASVRSDIFGGANTTYFFASAIHPLRFFLFSLIPDKILNVDQSLSASLQLTNQIKSSGLMIQSALIIGLFGFLSVMIYRKIKKKPFILEEGQLVALSCVLAWMLFLLFVGGRGFLVADALYLVPVFNSFRFLHKAMLVMPGLLILPLCLLFKSVRHPEKRMCLCGIILLAIFISFPVCKANFWPGGPMTPFSYLPAVVSEENLRNYRVLRLTGKNDFLEMFDGHNSPVGNKNVSIPSFSAGGYDLAYGATGCAALKTIYGEDEFSFSCVNIASLERLTAYLSEPVSQENWVRALKEQSVRYILCAQTLSLDPLAEILTQHNVALRKIDNAADDGPAVYELDGIQSLCTNQSGTSVMMETVSMDRLVAAVTEEDTALRYALRYQKEIRAELQTSDGTVYNLPCEAAEDGSISVSLKETAGKVTLSFRSMLDTVCLLVSYSATVAALLLLLPFKKKLPHMEAWMPLRGGIGEENKVGERSNPASQNIAKKRDENMLTTGRMRWLDVLKGIGMLMTIAGHSLVTNAYLSTTIWAVHMPLFFICSGITFKPYSRSVALRKNIKRLMIPYAFGCLVLLLFDLFLSRMIIQKIPCDMNTVWMLIKDYACRMIYGSGMYTLTSERLQITFNAIGALWFFCALFVSRLIYNEISYFPKNWKPLLVLVLFAFGYKSTSCLTATKGIWLPFSFQTGVTALIFLYMGEMIRLHMNEIKKHKGAVLSCSLLIYGFIIYCGVGVGMVGNSYGMGYVSILGALFGTMVWLFAAKYLVAVPFIAQGLEWIGKRTDKFLIFHLAELNFMPWQNIVTALNRDIGTGVECLCTIYICKILFGVIMVVVSEFLVRKTKKGFSALKQKRICTAS